MQILVRSVTILYLCLFGILAEAQDFGTRIDLENEELSADALAVWTVIDRYWGRSGCCGRENLIANHSYLDLISDDGVGWYFGAAGPDSKASVEMWAEKMQQPRGDRPPYAGTRLMYQLFPQSLVIHDNTAVVHYRYELAYVNKENPDKVDRSSGRYTDVLVRDNPGPEWKYLSWIGGRLDD